MDKVLITAALPYVNAQAHLGHLRSTYLPSDIYARYLRLKGQEVAYICATDEHGTPIVVSAEAEGIPPLEIANKYHTEWIKDLRRMGCSFNEFGRTTSPVHYRLTQDFFTRLVQKNYVYNAKYEQLFCPSCQRFLPDRYVEGVCPYCDGEKARGDACDSCGRYLKPHELKKPYCVSCGTVPEIRSTNHWFFKLSVFTEYLINWIETNKELPSNVKNYALQWLREGLKDWCITRDMNWGVPVPIDDVVGKVIYVWFDAPLGYISTTKNWSHRLNEQNKWVDYWQNPHSRIVHFIGKDIIYHHAIFWPAMLKAHGEYNLPSAIIAGEYLTLEGKKMSKSRGWSVEIREYLELFEPDPLRYHLVAVSPLNKDADFSWDEYLRRNNNELADILGNFIHRTLMFIYQFFDKQVPPLSKCDETDREMLRAITKTKKDVEAALEQLEFHQALRSIMGLAGYGNKYLNDKQPWKTLKVNRVEAMTTLNIAIQVVRVLAVMLEPFLPFSAEKLWKLLNLPGEIHNQRWSDIGQELAAGHEIVKPQPLFRKIHPKEVPSIK